MSIIAKTMLHGVFLNVFGNGVLLTGASGIGKSELALALISNGHQLIADDVVIFAKHDHELQGECDPALQDLLEVRGLGILNIRTLYGDKALAKNAKLQQVIHLKNFSPTELANIDRINGHYCDVNLLGIHIPEVTLPVIAGRNLVVLVEAAVRKQSASQVIAYEAQSQNISHFN